MHTPEQTRKKAAAMAESKYDSERNVVGQRISESDYNNSLKAGAKRDLELESSYRESAERAALPDGDKRKF